MTQRISISVKILLLALLNLLLLLLVFAAFARLEYRFDLKSFLLSPGRDRILATSRLIALELPATRPEQWNGLMAQYGSAYGGQCYLFSSNGAQLAGSRISPPARVLAALEGGILPRKRASASQRGSAAKMDARPLPSHVLLIMTRRPTRCWIVARIPIWRASAVRPQRGALLWSFSSLWTNGLLFNYRAWLAVVGAVLIVSVACWLPLIQGLTRSISQITDATGALAMGRLETRLSIRRRDELGQLSEAINHMAERLSGFVKGQRRFLGDIAHELCSPLARMEVGLGVLEQRSDSQQREYVLGVKEEVEHMSALINELLRFSKAGIGAPSPPLSRVSVAETVRRVAQLEANGQAQIEIYIEERLSVLAQPESLFRSIANIVRNAIRYAGKSGPIEVRATAVDGTVSITVSDHGPGLPESELEEVFKPFYRPELARLRETGGSGLGLAIVKSSIEVCGGSVKCRNRSPHGLQVEIRLPCPKPGAG